MTNTGVKCINITEEPQEFLYSCQIPLTPNHTMKLFSHRNTTTEGKAAKINVNSMHTTAPIEGLPGINKQKIQNAAKDYNFSGMLPYFQITNLSSTNILNLKRK